MWVRTMMFSLLLHWLYRVQLTINRPLDHAGRSPDQATKGPIIGFLLTLFHGAFGKAPTA